ncbi:hypothetical protein ACIO1C_12905 [Streptomyces sp. NPDC087420]|uniref:hypothetical protein n=1 Tax=Streptomyces sp. NPDC087420 TaxID=3365785 RepID=UPI003832E4CD
MQQASLATDLPEKDPRADADRGGGRAPRPPLPFVVVAVAFVAAQAVLMLPGVGLGWDETVYVSQVSPQAPAAFFSAPRARGISFLVAPVAAFTTSVDVLRYYLALLSGGALLLGLQVWRRLLPVPALTLAGTLFATLWITLFYGPQVMPNLWVAFAALVATGCFLRAVLDPGDRAARAGLGCAVAVAALMRPTDACWLVAPLAVAALGVRSWRRPAVLVILAVGAAVGASAWIVEAYVSYGGLATRLHRAGEIQGGLGWHPAFGHQLRALEGRSLCRPCDMRWRDPATALWWFALPVLASGGVWAAARTPLRAVVLLPTLTGLVLAVPYLLTIDYAAARFLLPAYALLALPVAFCLCRLVTAVRPVLRPMAVAVISVVLLAHVGSQYVTADRLVSRSRATRDALARISTELHHQGVRPPCTVSGNESVRIAFQTGCSSRQLAGHDASISRTGLLELAARQPVGVLVAPGRPAPGYARGWRSVPLTPLPGQAASRVYLSPPARP